MKNKECWKKASYEKEEGMQKMKGSEGDIKVLLYINELAKVESLLAKYRGELNKNT